MPIFVPIFLFADLDHLKHGSLDEDATYGDLFVAVLRYGCSLSGCLLSSTMAQSPKLHRSDHGLLDKPSLYRGRDNRTTLDHGVYQL